jgi:hypothetical protein
VPCTCHLVSSYIAFVYYFFDSSVDLKMYTFFFYEEIVALGTMAHAYNPCYSGGRIVV